MTGSSNHELVLVIEELLLIAKAVMPTHHYERDRRILAGRDALSRLRSGVPVAGSALVVASAAAAEASRISPIDRSPAAEWDVAAALDLFMSEPGAPATRPGAIALILRDWLVGHGYFEPLPDRQEAH